MPFTPLFFLSSLSSLLQRKRKKRGGEESGFVLKAHPHSSFFVRERGERKGEAVPVYSSSF